MIALSPSKLVAGTWYRLSRSSDGVLCLESTADVKYAEPSAWAFCAEVPRHIARQLDDDESPDQVANVLNRALRALGYA